MVDEQIILKNQISWNGSELFKNRHYIVYNRVEVVSFVENLTRFEPRLVFKRKKSNWRRENEILFQILVLGIEF